MLHRHRKAGLHAMPVGSSAGQAATGAAPVGDEKVQTQAQAQQPYPQQAQQPYPQQVQQSYAQQGVPPQGFVQQQQPGFPAQQAPLPEQVQHGVPQQQYYPPQQVPQQVPSPLSAQQTGNSYHQS